MLNKPIYITQANIADTKTKYHWDEWHVEDAYQPGNEIVALKMADLSHRANTTMCIAIAEWIIWRYENLSNDIMPYLYLEAAWAGTVHNAYACYIETNDNDWRGIVRGPINITLTIVIDILWGYDDCVPGENAGWLSQLAELILPNVKPFITWRDTCIERLEKFYPKPQEDDNDLFQETNFGPWIPRELFNPQLPFEPKDTPSLIKAFIEKLDYTKNIFLHTPDEMLEFPDYNDTPYKIKINRL